MADGEGIRGSFALHRGHASMAYKSVLSRPAPADVPQRALLSLAERGLLGTRLARLALRRYCAAHLRDEYAGGADVVWERFQILLDGLRQSPIDAQRPRERSPGDDVEPPQRLFELTLGPRMLHGSAYFAGADVDLADAEEAMLALVAERAQLDDGQKILELGCGWGAMTLWMAQHLPHARIVSLCRSPQRAAHVRQRCAERGIDNVEVIEGPLDRLTLHDAAFDRVVSIEMFEHLRNYEVMLARIAGWLRTGGTLFVHMVCHRELMYTLENPGLRGWLGESFCAQRLMAAASTLLYFQRHMVLERHWLLPGHHYRRSIDAWLERQRTNHDEMLGLFAGLHGRDEAPRHLRRFRLALMAMAELFGYAHGTEWMLGHYRFAKR